jgi:hypothetical protein
MLCKGLYVTAWALSEPNHCGASPAVAPSHMPTTPACTFFVFSYHALARLFRYLEGAACRARAEACATTRPRFAAKLSHSSMRADSNKRKLSTYKSWVCLNVAQGFALGLNHRPKIAAVLRWYFPSATRADKYPAHCAGVIETLTML